MVWGHNGKTYFFSGTQYWRYDESEGRVELDYPRDMSLWREVPYHIDAAFQYTDGMYVYKVHYYFFFSIMIIVIHTFLFLNKNTSL